MEQLTIKKIERGLRGIRLGTKTPQESKVPYFLNKLEEMNSHWHSDYIVKFEKVKRNYIERNRK
tara:strand:- start:311 stop:502 length:192 start_codon:yes stop_codon:yes gene_type:complete